MTVTVRWQARYYERGIEYWWDYPPEVNKHLEELKDVKGGCVEWTYVYPKKRSRTHPSGTFVINDDDDAGPVVGASYRLFPRKRKQRNITDGIDRERPMRRIAVDDAEVVDDDESD